MKKYIISLLIITSCFGQRGVLTNQFKNKRVTNLVVTPITTNNQVEEIAYFSAHYLDVADKATIQTALDTYGSIRLGDADYTGVELHIGSNQSIYGHPNSSVISKITVLNGSTNVHLSNLEVYGDAVNFEAGSPITNSSFKHFRFTAIVAPSGVKLENCEFINFINSRLNFNFATSGYYRNCKFIKFQTGGGGGTVAGIIIKGNSTTPSYGNTHLWSNLLTPSGDAVVLDNLQDVNFVGIDGEMWNSQGFANIKPMFYAQNMGNLKITEIAGADYSSVPTGGFNIDASNLLIMDASLGSQVSSFISDRTKTTMFANYQTNYTKETTSGYLLDAQRTYDPDNAWDVYYNRTLQNGLIANSSAIVTDYLGTQKTPWIRPNWETLPDPLGANWKTERVGKPDSRAYIQNLIDTNHIADLPEGVFYIGSTLNVGSNSEGIIGKGTGKTIICGLTDDFPLITMYNKQVIGATFDGTQYILANITLQGGSKGQFFPEDFLGITYTTPQNVVFRDQAIGVHLYKMGGTDNNFWDNVSFVNCGIGLYQNPKPIENGDSNASPGYIDKTIWYGGQYINCDIGMSVQALRGNNLNAWVNSKFDGNRVAYENGSNAYPIIANCDFTNNTGNYVLRGGDISLYSCNFYNNTPVIATHNFVNFYAEGCNFLDNIQFSRVVEGNNCGQTILNSTIVGDVVHKQRADAKPDSSLFMNCNLQGNPTINKFMVTLHNEVPLVLIDATPNPYPQLLVTQ